jgi:hypothetical protein
VLLRIRSAVVPTLVVAALALSGCSGSKHDKTKSSSPAPTSSSASSSAAESADAAAVRQTYTRFADPAVPVAQKVALLQDGSAFAPALTALSKTDYAKTVGLNITNVQITSPKLATVTLDVLLSGSPVVRGQKGYAVKENGTWKIAGATFCGLLAAQGPVPPVCKTAAATQLPG